MELCDATIIVFPDSLSFRSSSRDRLIPVLLKVQIFTRVYAYAVLTRFKVEVPPARPARRADLADCLTFFYDLPRRNIDRLTMSVKRRELTAVVYDYVVAVIAAAAASPSVFRLVMRAGL